MATSHRRRLALVALSLLAAACSTSHSPSPAASPEPTLDVALPVPVTGLAVPEMEHYDRLITDLMFKWGVPGGAVAVAKDGRLIFAHGYGLSDVESGEHVQPDALFRIASVSKPITAVAVLELAEQGRLDLDAKVFDILSAFRPDGGFADARLDQITVRQLLYHTGGWDRSASGDPMFASRLIATELGIASPPNPDEILRYMTGRPLEFDPGSRHVYSNFGYSVLGRIIEAVTEGAYEDFVRDELLAPLGITRMALGRSLPDGRREGEVRYYGHADEVKFPSVFDSAEGQVPFAYGGFSLEAADAAGGWIASAVDLLRFTLSVDGSREPRLLETASLREMTTRPPLVADGSDSYYAMGWQVRPVGDDANWWHNGGVSGTRTLLVRTHDGFVWAALFNWGPIREVDFPAELDATLWQAFDETSAWPTQDLFDRYGSRTRR